MNDVFLKGEIPIGLGMAFAQNVDAMKHFVSLSEEEQQSIIKRAHTINSKQEMQTFVSDIPKAY